MSQLDHDVCCDTSELIVAYLAHSFDITAGYGDQESCPVDEALTLTICRVVDILG